MQVLDIIMKKRDGQKLSKEEIEFFISGFVKGEIPDYQAAAMVMAIYYMGMSKEELSDWTGTMIHSGDIIDLSSIPGVKTDKHSTGGVGDKTTILLGPWMAAVGLPVAKMSGRGLGHTGGTIDKLEAIPGFRTEISRAEMIGYVKKSGIAVAGQSGNLVPADKKLYALRDVTATVDSIPLIASSIMSKKIAAGADAIVLDVKVGSGAFMKTEEEAIDLSKAMVLIGERAGRNTIAVISNMEQPLGYAVGNGLEVIEAIDALKGKGPEDLYELSYGLGSNMMVAAGAAADGEEAKQKMREVLANGKALQKFKEMTVNQGGNPAVADDYHLFPQAAYRIEINAGGSGYVTVLNGQEIGMAVKEIGGGRTKLDDELDLSAGVCLQKKIGDQVSEGECIAVLYGNDQSAMAAAVKRIQAAYEYGEKKPEKKPMIYQIITKEDL